MTDCDKLKFLNIDKIKDTARSLNSLGPDAEPEFLAIGKVLNTLSTICYGMTDNAFKFSNLPNFKAGENDLETCSFIERNAEIFDGVAAHVNETVISLNGGEHLLAELLLQVKKLRVPIRNLCSIGKTFRVLGVGIKVESSRTKDSLHGFALLAEEVVDIA